MTDLAGGKVSLAPLGTQIGFAKTASASGACTAEVAGIDVAVRVVSGLTVAIGDKLLILRHGSQRFAISKVVAAPAAPPPPPPPADPEAPPPVPPPSDAWTAATTPKPITTDGTLLVSPLQTGTFRAGSWRTDLGPVDSAHTLQGFSPWQTVADDNTGAVFYGTAARSLAGATITKATVRIERTAGGIQAPLGPTLWLVTQSVKPAGAPTLNESTSGPALYEGGVSTFDLPPSWGQALVDGTRGGIAVKTSGSNISLGFNGKYASSTSWTLTLYWRR